ncbi:hypothetical protein LguiB_033974 [Lonicera macranthoides]
MEDVGITIPIPPHHHDPLHLSPVGSPEITDSHLDDDDDELPRQSDELPHLSDERQSHQTVALTDDLRHKIIRQVEYYLSDENLQTDKFLMNYLTKDKDGFVPVGVIASFRKMKKLTQDRSLIVAALRESSVLVVSSSGKKVRRLHAFPFAEVKDPKSCTVLVENLPEDHSTENIKSIFGSAGNINNICIRDPNAVRDPRKCTVGEKLLSGKLHALVEYETVEAAEKAVATLNDEQDWRYGMRVKLLKAMAKHGQRKKSWKDPESEKNCSVQASDPADRDEELHDVKPDEENADHLSKEKNENKDRNRGRSRRQRYRGSNGHGHGTVSATHTGEPSKPPPGPKMPDGTRGFTMGRGRPLPFDQN